jgi:aryl-alcohol dehydrogenase-like predicted oxidoreductase
MTGFLEIGKSFKSQKEIQMQLIKLADTDLAISQIALGCMSLKGNLQENKAIILKALDAGISFLDTADLYQFGLNEEIVGAAIQGKRNAIVLATKVGNQPTPDGKGWTWNPRKSYILKAVEGSLKRLKTDYIDLYQLHGGTIEDPFEEILEAFELLKSQGKIRAFGISSIRPNVIRKLTKMNSISTLMLQYNPLDRRPEEEVFDLLETTDIRILVRGAFAKGVLIDKESGFMEFSPAEVQNFRKQILSFGFSPEAILIRFGLSQQSVASLVIGASHSLQIEQMIRGYEESFSVSTEIIEQVKAIFPPQKYDQHRF